MDFFGDNLMFWIFLWKYFFLRFCNVGWVKSEMILSVSILNRECFEKIKLYIVYGNYNILRV